MAFASATAQSNHRPRPRRMAYQTDTVMVHDPVLAWENGTYYLLSTGNGLQWATSKDRQSWIVQPTPFIENLPQWTRDSVPGFTSHVWAPDIIRWHDRWLLAYSCSTFGKNTSAIGLMSADHLNGQWRDEGCIVASKEKRDQWNAIDPAFVVDDNDQLWMTWGSFWDGIQMAKLEMKNEKYDYPLVQSTTPDSHHISHSSFIISPQKTIARRYRPGDKNAAENPTSKFAGRNAIEAPFILKHGGWYYLFVSWDYCCRGAQSNYRVAVGRSKTVDGPYTDRDGKPMTEGGGTIFIEGDKQEFEAAGHCAAYDLPTGETIFICHGYSTKLNGASILIQRKIVWTNDGWPTL
ncbi:MAG: family 43 glycosylhydrolase [Prevotella sp.]|nr:family 43 glycosylhydrolase [Prevotella sp.]